MHRFFLPSDCWAPGDEIYFPQDVTRQMLRVLRLNRGQKVIVLDDGGSEYVVELTSLSPRETVGKIVETRPAGGEPNCKLTLYLCLCQREKFEWMLQKCTEIGAVAFVPMISERSLVQDDALVEKKYDRWRKIIKEAAEQCGRGQIPTLTAPMHFKQAVQATVQAGCAALIPWEGEHTTTLTEAMETGDFINGERRISVFIGPEGGFSVKEIKAASTAGITPITLGPRILRMETAAVVTATLILHELGDLQ
jgi:16S rRNA (uracil1498-N3)-methyltransferase